MLLFISWQLTDYARQLLPLQFQAGCLLEVCPAARSVVQTHGLASYAVMLSGAPPPVLMGFSLSCPSSVRAKGRAVSLNCWDA